MTLLLTVKIPLIAAGGPSWFWCGQRLFDDPGYDWSDCPAMGEPGAAGGGPSHTRARTDLMEAA